jgi:plasmid stabilization system protein ParE
LLPIRVHPGLGRARGKSPAQFPPSSAQKHSLALPYHFPYRVIYEVDEAGQTVIVAAVLHAARHDQHWQSRVGV